MHSNFFYFLLFPFFIPDETICYQRPLNKKDKKIEISKSLYVIDIESARLAFFEAFMTV